MCAVEGVELKPVAMATEGIVAGLTEEEEAVTVDVSDDGIEVVVEGGGAVEGGHKNGGEEEEHYPHEEQLALKVLRNYSSLVY